MDQSDLIEFDRRHLWHPYTSMMDPLPAYAVASAQGVRLRLEDGRELIDGMSSWWCAIHGYNHPDLNRAAQEQLERMAHVMFGGLTHAPAVELGRRLIGLAPGDLQHVFLADSGSVSIEVAIKMALQYWIAQNESGKSKLLALRGAYHGDTIGAMAVCDPVNGMHQLFTGVLPQHFFVDRPQCRFGDADVDADLQKLESVLKSHHGEIAAMILEPIVQGAGGMWFYSAEYLRRAVALCRRYDVLVIADEIATGFGRAGRLFACEYAEVVPDIMCVGKALTGGYLTLGATLANPRVAKGISADGGVLMHGPTFMGNPLACAVANASLELLQKSDWQRQVIRIESQLKTQLSVYNNHPEVADVRVMGAIGVVEAKTPVDVGKVQRRLVDAGVWIRPFGRLIYLMPPYIISDEDLARLCAAIDVALDEN